MPAAIMRKSPGGTQFLAGSFADQKAFLDQGGTQAVNGLLRQFQDFGNFGGGHDLIGLADDFEDQQRSQICRNPVFGQWHLPRQIPVLGTSF